MAQRAVIIIRGCPSNEEASDAAWELAETYGDDTVEAVAYELRDDLPEWLNVGMRDQLSAHRRDAGEPTTCMVVYMGTSEEIQEGWE